ncbi:MULTISPECIES: hypothetical protein [Moorena]|uniref:Uncharacterized protein n=3 Tax=Moorena TaxID=1155738 RepID=A0A1D9FXM4_MOOP1|nr:MULTISPECIES: hypothetical protein [Moorena]NEQ09178.1 hypothetical protein [Moorena sp. SIO4E2]NEQ14525.1 hypothetical protein [Moorena sp. SIO3E2]AOY80122.1 hypothetical protein BJP36_09465 [Moorena producens JHB]EGJ34033.1 hypothetical protein LYNGBM3L_23000 [Moorena producens 3L]NEP30058.1 hypothetical protein [Moorena sp. SIO3B2]
MMMIQRKTLVIICLILIAVVGVVINVKLLQVWNYNTEGHDIYYSWVEGKRILSGQNPYARVLSGNMR